MRHKLNEIPKSTTMTKDQVITTANTAVEFANGLVLELDETQRITGEMSATISDQMSQNEELQRNQRERYNSQEETLKLHERFLTVLENLVFPIRAVK